MADAKSANVGGLWLRSKEDGEEYFFGRIIVDGKTIDFRGYENKLKTNESYPAEKREKFPDIQLFLIDKKATKPVAKKTNQEKPEENPL